VRMIVDRMVWREDGIVLPTVLAVTVITTLLVGTMAMAINGDISLTRRDLHEKQAYEAARAGIADYAFHLNNDTSYWARCTDVPDPNAVNQQGSTANRRPVPGSSGAEYAIELLPAGAHSQCDTSDPAASMLEGAGDAEGTFRIRATGYSGDTEQSIVAQFKRAGFLDFLYFTQLETSDPVTYGNYQTIQGANQQCTKFYREGRQNQSIPYSGGRYCDVISFISGEHINGPLHTNDSMAVCGTPTFGRTPADKIEVAAPPAGWFKSCGGTFQPNFQGTYVTHAPVLTPPPTNGSLRYIADPAYRFDGQVEIELSGEQMEVTSSTGTETLPFPENGVVYVSNGDCAAEYSPFTATYDPGSGCGNALVSGSYSGKLTIATENDIIVDGDLVRSGEGLLGLIANNFVRVQHQFDAQQSRSNCGGGSNGPATHPDIRIDAAILAIQHSFIVDHYNCGSSLGKLTVNGAIAQRFRGAVGTFGYYSTGYSKDYNYDDRLRFLTPPHFLDPVETAWAVQRETID
jgi:Tfp pilus assembly protein PilX